MTSPGTVAPTEAERMQADDIVSRWPFKGNAYFDRAVADIAQALADQRARFEEALRDVEELALGLRPCDDFWRGNIDGLNNAVRLIRDSTT